jgi:pimeloyl-ACP methyl ester carboxylesterase
MASPMGRTADVQQAQSRAWRGSPAILLRLGLAFGVTLVGMSWIDGWATDSSLVWLAWLTIGILSGLVAGSARAIWLVAPATLLVYPVTAVFGRSATPVPQPEQTGWAVLVLVGGAVTAAGFAIGAAFAERRAGWILALAMTTGMLGVVVWGGYSGYVGSNEVLNSPPAWRHCDTPASRYGWAYEAINYDPADDARLAAGPGGLHDCASQGSKAGSEVVTEDGIGIAGWYIPAANGAAATAPTFVIAPGWKSNKTEVLKYAPFFHDRFNLVIVDLRNQGRSGGDVTTWGYNERMDVRAILDWLERTKHPSWIGAMGNSMGAATVLGTAAVDPRIRALILDSMHASMVDSFADGLAHERNLPGLPTAWAVVGLSTLRSGVDIGSVDPVRTIGTLGDRPVLLIHGTDDVLDTVDHAAKPNLAAAETGGVPVTIRYCEGGRHGGLVDACPGEWQAWVDAFLGGIPDLQVALAAGHSSREGHDDRRG